MTNTFNKTLTGILGLALVLGVFTPFAALAQEDETFCELAESKKSETIGQIQDAVDRHLERRDTFLTDVSTQKDKARDKYLELKERYLTEIDDAYNTLLNSNPNDEQKVALETFKTNMITLIEARNVEHNELNDAWHADMSAEANAISDEVNGALLAGKAGIETAYDKVIADCSAGVDRSDIRAELLASADQIKADWNAAKEEFNIKSRIGEILSQRKNDQVALIAKFRDDARAEGEILRVAWEGADTEPEA